MKRGSPFLGNTRSWRIDPEGNDLLTNGHGGIDPASVEKAKDLFYEISNLQIDIKKS